MRLPMAAVGTAILMLIGATSSIAHTATVAVVKKASAGYSPVMHHTIVVRAQVELPTSCWSHPRLKPRVMGDLPEGEVGFAVLADVSVRPGTMCAQHVRTVWAPAFRWTTYPSGVKSIHVVGTSEAADADIRRTGM